MLRYDFDSRSQHLQTLEIIMIYTLTLNPAVDRELTVPAIEFDSVLRASDARVDFGGKGFNVSRLLKGMNTPSTAVGFLGGRAGELLQDGLQGLGIGTDFVWVPGETRTNVSIVTESHDHYVKVNEKGPLVDAGKQKELLDKIDLLANPGDWWVLAGSLPPGVADDFYARVIYVLNKHDAQSILDTSGESLKTGCAEKPYLVKPNAEEAHVLTGLPMDTPSEIAGAAAEIRRMGAQNVAISMGKAGALLHTAEGTWLTHSPKIKEKNPIGAGDSMVGGLVWGLTQAVVLKEALGWGVASGAATASLPGTEVGSRPLIEELFSQVRFERLESV
jgi:1-phosphofructokinase family hexose kinase